MQPHGSDRARIVAGRVILHSRLAKGWTPRTLKTLTHSEHPGTAVLWGEEYFEVVAADALPNGGVRYVLEAWRDDHVMRTFEHYDDESEARLTADYALAQRQRRHSGLARIAGIVLGQLPSPVQNRLANELGVSAPRMTLISCLPPLIILGVCAYIQAGAKIEMQDSPIPLWLWLLVLLMMMESLVRFFVAMSQNRPMGTLFGTIAYAVFHIVAGPKRDLPKPFEESGDGVFFMIPPEEDVAMRDSLLMRAPMLTLLSAKEQTQLARSVGFKYREHAFGLTWTILVLALLGAATSFVKVQNGRGITALLSLLVALAFAIEQIVRLIALQRGPAGSMLAVFVRPFVRDLLARR